MIVVAVGSYNITIIVISIDAADAAFPLFDLGHVVTGGQVRLASWMVVVVVVTDDPALLAAFAQQAREGRLLVWSTRLIVVTRREPHRYHPLHQLLALTNSLLLLVDGVAGVNRCVSVFLSKLCCLYKNVWQKLYRIKPYTTLFPVIMFTACM